MEQQLLAIARDKSGPPTIGQKLRLRIPQHAGSKQPAHSGVGATTLTGLLVTAQQLIG
jgi:hypothetical protein